jgi:hypothetical protein
MVNIVEILEKEDVEREEFDDGLYPIFVTQDEVKMIFDEMICLELEDKDLIDSKILVFTIMKFEKNVIFKSTLVS